MQQEISNRPHAFWGFLLLFLVFCVYAPSLSNGFALDDPITAKATLPNGNPNLMVSKLRPVVDYFTTGYWIGHDGQESDLFRPVTIYSYAVTNAVQRWITTNPDWEAFPHHLINVLLNVLAAFLALRMLLLLVAPRWALVGAAVFGLHAVHSEVVAGIVGRAELFGFCYGAGALLAFECGRERRALARAVFFMSSAVLLFLSFGSKENSLAWAPFLVVFAWVRDRVALRGGAFGVTVLQAALVALVPVVVFFVLRSIALEGVPSPFPIHRLANPLAHVSTQERLVTAVAVWGAYGFGKCVWPMPLMSDYGPETITVIGSIYDWRFALSAPVLLGGLVLAWRRRSKDPVLFLAVACFLGFSFVTTNIPVVIGTVFGERLYFTPSLACAIGVGWLLGKVRRRMWVLVPTFLWLGMSCFIIFERNPAWRNETTLTVADAVKNPRNLRLVEAYASHLDNLNRDAEAEVWWQNALAIDPDYVNALSSYGGFLARQGKFGDAEELFLRALRIRDDNRLRHITQYNLALLYDVTKRPELALRHARSAWREPMAFAVVHEPLLDLCFRLMKLQEFAGIVAEGETRAPLHPVWVLQRAYIASAKQEWKKSIGLLRRALMERPGHPATRWALAATLLRRNRRAEALPILDALRKDKRAPPDLRKRARQALKAQ